MAQDISIVSEDPLRRVAFKVCTALDRIGVRAVLCGGSAAEIYVPQAYQSGDVDFIAQWFVDSEKIDAAVAEIGFMKKGRIYVCADNPVTLDFPSDDLMIWDEAVTAFDTLQEDGLVLHVQTPFDTVRDRLCWFFVGQPDYQSMRVAAEVARAYDIDVHKLEIWAERIGEAKRFAEFKAYLMS